MLAAPRRTDDPDWWHTRNLAMQRRQALVIGVNSPIQAKSIHPLRHAEQDAAAMAETLMLLTCGFSLLTPPLLGAQATTSRVRSAILSLARNCDDDDFLLLYFSGHG